MWRTKIIMEFSYLYKQLFSITRTTICKQSDSAPNSCKIWKASTTIVLSSCWSICTKLLISLFTSASSSSSKAYVFSKWLVCWFDTHCFCLFYNISCVIKSNPTIHVEEDSFPLWCVKSSNLGMDSYSQDQCIFLTSFSANCSTCGVFTTRCLLK